MTEPNTDTSKAVVTTTPIDPTAPSTTAIVTTQPLPTALRIVMVLVAGAVAITAGLIAVFADTDRGVVEAMLGFAAFVFATSNTTIGGAFIAALSALTKRPPGPPTPPPSRTAGSLMRPGTTVTRDTDAHQRSALRSGLAWASLIFIGLALCGLLAGASGCASREVQATAGDTVEHKWKLGPPCILRVVVNGEESYRLTWEGHKCGVCDGEVKP